MGKKKNRLASPSEEGDSIGFPSPSTEQSPIPPTPAAVSPVAGKSPKTKAAAQQQPSSPALIICRNKYAILSYLNSLTEPLAHPSGFFVRNPCYASR
jgi:hypothetical protein